LVGKPGGGSVGRAERLSFRSTGCENIYLIGGTFSHRCFLSSLRRSWLPNQKGPLAPDKIVFRDGWGKDSAYLLVNLRFTGWHRYKATGTVTLVYQGGTLSADVLDGKPFSWLPVGRSLFRDKRIPWENLNGLVMEKTGMAAVLYRLTGIGGRGHRTRRTMPGWWPLRRARNGIGPISGWLAGLAARPVDLLLPQRWPDCDFGRSPWASTGKGGADLASGGRRRDSGRPFPPAWQ